MAPLSAPRSEPGAFDVESCEVCLLQVDEAAGRSVGGREADLASSAREGEGRRGWAGLCGTPSRCIVIVVLLLISAASSVVGWRLAALRRAGREGRPVGTADLQFFDEQSETLPWYMGGERASVQQTTPPSDNLDAHVGMSDADVGPHTMYVEGQLGATVDEHLVIQMPSDLQSLDEQSATLPWYMDGESASPPPPVPRADEVHGQLGMSASGHGFDSLRASVTVDEGMDRLGEVPRADDGSLLSPPASLQIAPAPSSQTEKPLLPPPTLGDGGAACAAADGKLFARRGESQFHSDMTGCSTPCLGDPGCTSNCFAGKVGYTAACSSCFGELSGCTRSRCLWYCIGGDSLGCRSCADERCRAGFERCSGLSLDWSRYGDATPK